MLQLKQIIYSFKPYLRWVILGITLFFLAKTCLTRWQEVKQLEIAINGWLMLILALITTFLAHIWSAGVWFIILRLFQQAFGLLWAVRVYLITNIAKYMPGNVWHFAGRISAVKKAGGSLGIATLSVLLEPLLMAAAALIIGLLSNSLGLLNSTTYSSILIVQILILLGVVVGIHPKVINPILAYLSKAKDNQVVIKKTKLEKYPSSALLGEMGFLLLRGSGFAFTLVAFMNINYQLILPLLSAFSFAWLLGLIVPGAPGGVGVFEATIIALLNPQFFPPAIVLSSVVIFRLISILAEVLAAGLAVLMPKAKY